MIGRTLAQYTIFEKIGEGGMGEVWKARDTSLAREVAIKILPEEFARDSDRRARFEQEATLLGGLDHPNLATIYGLHHEDGIHFIAMELVPGTDLSHQLKSGPFQLRDALEIGAQVADALAAAHDQGVVHRDLKPGNIMVTPEGRVKLLDFGLARSIVGGSGSSPDVLTQTTKLVSPETLPGVILGTAVYMSPEQARGKPVDSRTDLWAFGCVLYEMLTGHVLFLGESLSDTVVKILEHEPDWDRLPEGTPAGIKRLLRRCLTKDARRRQQSAGDARLEMEEALSGDPAGEPASPVSPFSRSRAALLAMIAIPVVALGWLLKPSPESGNTFPIHSEINAPQGLVVTAVGNSLVLSPDGTRLAFIGRTHHEGGSPDTARIYVRNLDEDRATPLPGTESVITDKNRPGPSDLFFSPDGRWLGFTVVPGVNAI